MKKMHVCELVMVLTLMSSLFCSGCTNELGEVLFKTYEEEKPVVVEVEQVTGTEQKPETEPETESELEPESENNPEQDAETGLSPDQETEPEIEPETEVKPDSENEQEQEVEPEVESETESGQNSESEVEPEPEAGPEIEGENESETESEPAVETEPQTEPELESEVVAETEGGNESETETEPAAETEPEPETEPETETEQESGAETEPEPETETATETDPETETESEPEPEPEPYIEPFAGICQVNFMKQKENIYLTWDEDEGADEYVVMRKTDGSEADYEEIYRGKELAFTDKKVDAWGRYLYRLDKIKENTTFYGKQTAYGFCSPVSGDQWEDNDSIENAVELEDDKEGNLFYCAFNDGTVLKDSDWFYVVIPSHRYAEITLMETTGSTDAKKTSLIWSANETLPETVSQNEKFVLRNTSGEKKKFYFQITQDKECLKNLPGSLISNYKLVLQLIMKDS